MWYNHFYNRYNLCLSFHFLGIVLQVKGTSFIFLPVYLRHIRWQTALHAFFLFYQEMQQPKLKILLGSGGGQGDEEDKVGHDVGFNTSHGEVLVEC